MIPEKTTEIIQLDIDRKWEYLKCYYEAAAKFYDIKDRAVSEEDIDKFVRGFKELPEPVVRKKLNLKNWKFIPDNDDLGIKNGYFLTDKDENGWEDVTIPHAFSNVPPEPELFGRTGFCVYTTNDHPSGDILRDETHAWYKTRIPLDELNRDSVAYLGFGSVNLNCDVWVNENPVITDHLGLFPFDVEVTESLGKDPVIAVRVSNTVSNVPHMFYNGIQFSYYDKRYTGGEYRYDWQDMSWAGLAEDAALTVINKKHIKDVFIHTEHIGGGSARISLDIGLRNQSKQGFTGKVSAEISVWGPAEGPTIKTVTADCKVLPLNDGEIHMTADIPAPELWSPESPNLYLAHLVLYDEADAPIDDMFESFGIRTFEIKGSYFYLNGKKTVLRGTHDVCNYYGEPVICPSDKTIVRDILMHKGIGANCSRWPSDIRLNNKKIAQYCDQMGFMLSWAGYLEIWTQHSDINMLMSRDVGEVIRSLRNHPSIVIWEMGDEALMTIYDYRRIQFYDRMITAVTAEDPTRPVIPSGSWCNELIDTILSYPGDDIEEKRKRALEEYPVFARGSTVWDYHKCPYFPPFPPELNFIRNAQTALGGLKPTVYTEFGCDALPNPENVADVYGGFRWKANAFITQNRDRLDMGQYGRLVTPEDWRETQAFQSVVVCGIIDRLRQFPDAFAAYYFVTMFDVWTFYWGAADAKGSCKLNYYTVKNHFDPLFISALHGGVTASIADGLTVSVSNYGGDVSDAALKVELHGKDGQIALRKEIGGISAGGDVELTDIASIDLTGLSPGLYSIEYYLEGADGKQLGKMFEMAYFE